MPEGEVVGVKVAERTRVAVERRGDVLYASYAGLFHYLAYLEVRGHVRAELLQTPTRAVVLDLRQAVFCLDAAAFDAIAEMASLSSPAVRTPTAVVVKEHTHEALTTLCARLWERGFYWATYEDFDDAERWAVSRRVHWSHVPGLSSR